MGSDGQAGAGDRGCDLMARVEHERHDQAEDGAGARRDADAFCGAMDEIVQALEHACDHGLRAMAAANGADAASEAADMRGKVRAVVERLGEWT